MWMKQKQVIENKCLFYQSFKIFINIVCLYNVATCVHMIDGDSLSETLINLQTRINILKDTFEGA